MQRGTLVAAALMVGLTGCASSSAEGPTGTDATAPATSSTAGPELRMGELSQAPGPVPAPGTAAAPAPVQETVELAESLPAATAYANDQGITVGIAVLDRETGQEFTNGAVAGQQMWSASVSKLFLADDLLFRDRAGSIALTDAERVLIQRMLESSDDTAADTLYLRYGAESMVTKVSQRLGLPGISASTDPGEWELTDISAVAVVRWYHEFMTTANPADRDLIVGLLQSAEPVATDGFDQRFGLPAMVTGEPLAYKQGWMCCPASTSFLHTTGLVGADSRYAVAVLTERPTDSGYATDVLDRITQIAFPAGIFAP